MFNKLTMLFIMSITTLLAWFEFVLDNYIYSIAILLSMYYLIPAVFRGDFSELAWLSSFALLLYSDVIFNVLLLDGSWGWTVFDLIFGTLFVWLALKEQKKELQHE